MGLDRGRQALMPVGRLLIRLADAQRQRFLIAAANDLQRGRQALGGAGPTRPALAGPTPGILSSSDVTVRIARRLRL